MIKKSLINLKITSWKLKHSGSKNHESNWNDIYDKKTKIISKKLF